MVVQNSQSKAYIDDSKLSPLRSTNVLSLSEFRSDKHFPANDLLLRFLTSNPSFKGNTPNTYLTQISHFLVDWLFEIGYLPVKYKSLADDAKKAKNLFSSNSLSESKKIKLHSRDRIDQGEFVRCGTGRGVLDMSLPKYDISYAKQNMLSWLLSKNSKASEGEFWSHILSSRCIGEALYYYRYESNPPLSTATICLRMGALSHFRNFISKEFNIKLDPLDFKAPRADLKFLPVIQVSELEIIASQLSKDAKKDGGYLSLRNELVFEIFYTTGIRASELIDLKYSDINLKKSSIKVKQKGGKYRELPLIPQTIEKLKRFFKVRDELIKIKKSSETDQQYLFHTRRGFHLKRNWVFDIVRKIGEKSGISDPLGPHTIRRSMACALYDNGAPLHAVQQLLGHRSIQTTANYLAHGMRSAAETVDIYHPWGLKQAEKNKTTKVRISKSISFKPAGRNELNTKSFKVRSLSSFLNPCPGFLNSLIQHDTKDTALDLYTIEKQHTRGKPVLSSSTKKNYQTDLRQFLLERFRDLTLPISHLNVCRAIMTTFLADRIDWLVRTDELSVKDGEKLFSILEKAKLKALPIKDHFPKSDKAVTRLLKGVTEKIDHEMISLSLPPVLHLDSDKNRGFRSRSIINHVLSSCKDKIDQTFWQEIFEPNKADKVIEDALTRGTQQRTLKRNLSSLRAVGQVLEKNFNIRGTDDKPLVQFAKIISSSPKRPQKIFQPEEVLQIIGILNKRCKSKDPAIKDRALHDRALFITMYSTAARAGSMKAVTRSDIDFAKSEIYLYEKRDRQVLLPLLPQAEKALSEYIESIPPTAKYIFHSAETEMIGIKYAERMLNELCASAGIVFNMRGSNNVGSHIMRRSAAVHMANNGASLIDLQKFLGHKNIADTASYVEHGLVNLKEAQSYLPKFSLN